MGPRMLDTLVQLFVEDNISIDSAHNFSPRYHQTLTGLCRLTRIKANYYVLSVHMALSKLAIRCVDTSTIYYLLSSDCAWLPVRSVVVMIALLRRPGRCCRGAVMSGSAVGQL